jgi:hypothetical protein
MKHLQTFESFLYEQDMKHRGVTIDYSDYYRTHGRAPSINDRGVWAFSLYSDGLDPMQTPSMSFSQAKDWAADHASRWGKKTVYLLG